MNLLFTTLVLGLIRSGPVDDLLFQQAKAWASSVPNLSLQTTGEGAVFVGEIIHLEEAQILSEFLKRGGGRVSSQVEFSPAVLEEIKNEISGLMPSLDRSDGTTRGQVNSRVKRRSSDRSLHLELAFIEIRQSRIEQFGVRFGSPIEFSLNRFSDLDMNPLGFFLDLALQKGDARIHYKQSLIAQEAIPAHFEVGGEYSVRLTGSERSRLDKISYGIRMEFKARFLDDSWVEIETEALVREPDLANGIDGLPLIQTKKVKTKKRLRLGETSALAGIYQLSKNAFRQEVPGVAQLPLFGSLLSSRNYQARKTEAYLFVTPTEISGSWQPRAGRRN